MVGVLVGQGNVYVVGSWNALPVDTAGHPRFEYFGI